MQPIYHCNFLSNLRCLGEPQYPYVRYDFNKLDFQTYLVGAQLACELTELLIYSFHIQVGWVAAHKQHTFRSGQTNTQLTPTLPQRLCFPAYFPSVIQLWEINQKASFSHPVEEEWISCLVVKSRPTRSFLFFPVIFGWAWKGLFFPVG